MLMTTVRNLKRNSKFTCMIQTIHKVAVNFYRMRKKSSLVEALYVLFLQTTTCAQFQVNIIPSRVAQMSKNSAEWKSTPDAIIYTSNHCFHFHNIVDMIFFYSRSKKNPIKKSVLCASVFYSITLHFLIRNLLFYKKLH